MLTTIFDPLHRFLANPQLAWIVLWIGLALLIVALIVMICTSWGQSQPLRKCAALSLLAHLLLAGYATTFEIVTASSGRRGSIDVVFVDGDPDGNADFGMPEGDNPGLALGVSTALNPAEGDRDNSRAAASSTGAQSAADLNQAISPTPTPAANLAPPPLLDVAKAPPAIDTPEKVVAAEPEKPVANSPEPDSQVAAGNAIAATTETVASENDLQPLAAANANSELAKLPEPPTTPLNGDWVAGEPVGATQLDRQGSEDQNLSSSIQVDGKIADPASQTNAATSKVQSTNSSTFSSDASGVRTTNSSAAAGPVVESAAPKIASQSGPQIYADRTAGDRAAILRQRGGSPEGEFAVQAALRWLAANQSADGRWDADKFGAGREIANLGRTRQGAQQGNSTADSAVTGLAVLAFLGAGNTHLQGEYSQNVRNGLEYLLRIQAPDGNLGNNAEPYVFMYAHGMGTLALSEAYAMTGDKRLEPAVKAAINYTVSAQIPITGGWRYRAREPATEMGDTSQLGWQLMALKSAELAGIEMPVRTREGIVRFIRSVSMGANGGIASYQPGVRKPNRTMTAEALVCRQFMGMTRDNPASNEAGDFMLIELPSPERINLYYWYYGTLGMYQLQGDHWQRWNSALQNTLVQRQRSDGDSAGSWDPECLWGGYGGRVYSTAMSALCLEVYYRYLPLYRVAGRVDAPASARQ